MTVGTWLLGFPKRGLDISIGRQTGALTSWLDLALCDFIVFTSSPVDLFFFLEVDANGTDCVLNLCLLFSV